MGRRGNSRVGHGLMERRKRNSVKVSDSRRVKRKAVARDKKFGFRGRFGGSVRNKC